MVSALVPRSVARTGRSGQRQPHLTPDISRIGDTRVRARAMRHLIQLTPPSARVSAVRPVGQPKPPPSRKRSVRTCCIYRYLHQRRRLARTVHCDHPCLVTPSSSPSPLPRVDPLPELV